MQLYDPDSKKLTVLPEEPIGCDLNGGKFLIVFDSDGFYVPQRIDCLHGVCNYYPMPRYKTLTLLFEAASSMKVKIILFDNWKEFYLWCAE